MLNYNFTRLFFALLIVSMIVIDLFFPFPWFFFLIAIFIYGLFLVFGAIKIQVNFFTKSINKINTNEKQIALTFDDAPVNGKTNIVLDILKANNIEAAFFCIGNRAENIPDLIKRMHNENHIIGNHSYSHHFFFDLKSAKVMQAELAKTDAIVEQMIGKKMRFFRPPYGVTNPNLAKAIKTGNYHSIGWSVRSMDTIAKTEQKLLLNITNNLKSGDIVLLHDSVDITIQSLQKIIDAIKAKGFEIVRLDKLLNLEAYA
jgi:peptidoglycan/xylan/chitin deacetylase (PgdA/CDA1 family)